MSEQTVESRVEALETRVTMLEELPGRMHRLELQIVQLRAENSADHSAIRQDLEELGTGLRAEMQTLGSQLRGEMQTQRTELRGEMQALGTELRNEMQALGTELRSEMQALGTELRGEMHTLGTELRGEMKTFGGELSELRSTMTMLHERQGIEMRVLFEDALSRIAAMNEGRRSD
jgi:hypothetical protein